MEAGRLVYFVFDGWCLVDAVVSAARLGLWWCWLVAGGGVVDLGRLGHFVADGWCLVDAVVSVALSGRSGFGGVAPPWGVWQACGVSLVAPVSGWRSWSAHFFSQ